MRTITRLEWFGPAALGWLVVVALGAGQRGVSARWLGQTGADRVGPSSKVEPSGVQDIVIRLGGLPALEIERIRVQGHGGDEWLYNGRYGPWAADLEREGRAPTAKLFLEPTRVETGRSFGVRIDFPGGRSTEIFVKGGRADPKLRTDAARMQAQWVGLDDLDRTGPGPSVGPDGFRDARIDLANLVEGRGIRAIRVQSQAGASWAYGRNPEGRRNAEFLRGVSGPPSTGSLWFSPTPDLAERPSRLKIELTYDDGTEDEAVIATEPVPYDRPADAPPTPEVRFGAIEAEWLGQDRANSKGRGYVQVKTRGWPPGRWNKAVLTNETGARWSTEPEGAERRLVVSGPSSAGELTIQFEPVRDETDSTLTLRLEDERGRVVLAAFEGGSCDPMAVATPPAERSVALEPGEDLVAAAQAGGRIRLKAGEHRLERPLELERPTWIEAEPGAVLRFRQGAAAEPWTEAIAVGSGWNRLEGLAIRFDGPIRWDRETSWGPAVIGAPTGDRRSAGPIVVELEGLDLEAPPADSEWEQAPHAFRGIGARGGAIVENTIRAGAIELGGGPWRIEGNRFEGPPARTFAYSVISAHSPHDFRLAENVVEPRPQAGKLWRFLVLTNRGAFVEVYENQIRGVGPRDDDAREHPNAPEILLTESYRLKFEGRPSAVSSDGRLITIATPQGERPEPGDVVALLDGPDAGGWRRIVQRLGDHHFALDEPLPSQTGAIAITPGFVGLRIEGNRIDAAGSTIATPLVLAGNHFGTRVAENTLIGGGRAFEILAYPSEEPVHWGWSRCPVFGLAFERNEVINSDRGGLIAVSATDHTKSSRGRLSFDGTLSENRFRWTGGDTSGRTAITIGQGPLLDPGALEVESAGNRALGTNGRAPRQPLKVVAGTVNGEARGARRPDAVHDGPG